MQNTARLTLQPNLLDKFKALSDSQLRLIVLTISAVLVGIGWYLFGSIHWLPIVLALSTVYSAPRIKDACLKTNKWLVTLSIVVLSATLVFFPLIPQLALGVVIPMGNIPLILGMVSDMQAQTNKRLGIKSPKPVKAKPVKVAKDPNRKKTNTQRKLETRLARQATKKK